MISSDNETSFDEFRSALEELPSAHVNMCTKKEEEKHINEVLNENSANSKESIVTTKLLGSNQSKLEKSSLQQIKEEANVNLIESVKPRSNNQLPSEFKHSVINQFKSVNTSLETPKLVKPTNSKPQINFKNAIDIPSQALNSPKITNQVKKDSPFKQQASTEDFEVHIIDDKSQEIFTTKTESIKVNTNIMTVSTREKI